MQRDLSRSWRRAHEKLDSGEVGSGIGGADCGLEAGCGLGPPDGLGAPACEPLESQHFHEPSRPYQAAFRGRMSDPARPDRYREPATFLPLHRNAQLPRYGVLASASTMPTRPARPGALRITRERTLSQAVLGNRDCWELCCVHSY